jgi:HAD superfamily hydrolase (TIGR01490 family)
MQAQTEGRGRAAGIAFFDVDGTVVRGATAVLAVRYLVARGRMSLLDLALGGAYACLHRINLMNYEAVLRRSVAPFVGMPEVEIDRLSCDCFDSCVKPRVYEQAAERVRHHRSRGDEVVLLSSGPRYLVNAVGGHLGVHHAVGSGPLVEDGKITDRFESVACHGEGKLVHARIYAVRLRVPLERCYFYSDSLSDLPLLGAVGHPRVVNPDPLLRLEARRRGWKVLRFRR